MSVRGSGGGGGGGGGGGLGWVGCGVCAQAKRLARDLGKFTLEECLSVDGHHSHEVSDESSRASSACCDVYNPDSECPRAYLAGDAACRSLAA